MLRGFCCDEHRPGALRLRHPQRGQEFEDLQVTEWQYFQSRTSSFSFFPNENLIESMLDTHKGTCACHLKVFRFSDMTWSARPSKETEARKRHQSAKLSPQPTGRTGIRRLTEWQYFQSPQSSFSWFPNEKWEDARSFCTSQRATLRRSQVLTEKPFLQMHCVNSVCRNSWQSDEFPILIIIPLDPLALTWRSSRRDDASVYCFVNLFSASWNLKNLKRWSKRAILRSCFFGFSVSDFGYHASVCHSISTAQITTEICCVSLDFQSLDTASL